MPLDYPIVEALGTQHLLIGEAWELGKKTFEDYSPRNKDVYDKIYAQAAEDYCQTCGWRSTPIDADVVATILAWPAIDVMQLQSLPPQLRNAVEDFLPDLESINYKVPLTSVFRAQALSNQVNDVLLFLSTIEMTGIEADIPHLHQRMMDAHKVDEKEACRRIWSKVTARLDGQNGGKPPKRVNKGPVFH